MENLRQVLVDRLVKKGADSSSLPGILRCLAKILSADPEINPPSANEKLCYLGWQEVKVDYHLLQLALACFESEHGVDPAAFAEDDRRRQALRLREMTTTPVAFGEA
ncbi:MAG: hypothetical protein E4H48_00290 [Syntrophobacterales bacterium]|nr:MAG: hypothetical protein E4H48_00290 [Syntrophobacterales bacterium]